MKRCLDCEGPCDENETCVNCGQKDAATATDVRSTKAARGENYCGLRHFVYCRLQNFHICTLDHDFYSTGLHADLNCGCAWVGNTAHLYDRKETVRSDWPPLMPLWGFVGPLGTSIVELGRFAQGFEFARSFPAPPALSEYRLPRMRMSDVAIGPGKGSDETFGRRK